MVGNAKDEDKRVTFIDQLFGNGRSDGEPTMRQTFDRYVGSMSVKLRYIHVRIFFFAFVCCLFLFAVLRKSQKGEGAMLYKA